MEHTRINDELVARIPEGFYTLDAQSVQALFNVDYPHIWGIRDDGRHVVVGILWKASNEALGKLVSTKSLVKRAEKATRKANRDNGYRFEGDLAYEVDGREALGFRHGYTVQGIDQTGEISIFRNGKTAYTLYYYTRTDLREANAPVFEDFVSSLAFS